MDQASKGHFIYVFNLQSPIHQFQALSALLQFRRPQIKHPFDPLFTDDTNPPASWFQKHLKAILRLSGFPTNNFSSHSFRIGAAITAV